MKTLLRAIFGVAYIGMLICTGFAYVQNFVVGTSMLVIDVAVWRFMRFMWKDGMINPFTGEKLE